MDLNKIFEIASSDKSDKGKIEAILEQCSKQTCVEFAYKVCLDIKHLMEDKRSLVAIEALKQYLDTGKPISREIIASAFASRAAAYAASSIASASSASYAAASAFSAIYAAGAISAIDAADAASSASYAAIYASHTSPEKDKQYLQLLIELIASSCSCEENKFLHEIMLCTS